MAEKTVNEMNIYYTAKDIEELVAKGVHQLELGPNTSLTDFARETAEQLDLALIDKTKETGPVKPPISSINKQRGPCQSILQQTQGMSAWQTTRYGKFYRIQFFKWIPQS